MSDQSLTTELDQGYQLTGTCSDVDGQEVVLWGNNVSFPVASRDVLERIGNLRLLVDARSRIPAGSRGRKGPLCVLPPISADNERMSQGL
jgi:hypothetical protein